LFDPTTHWYYKVKINDFKSAERNFKEALSIRRRLAIENPEKYIPYVELTLDNLKDSLI